MSPEGREGGPFEAGSEPARPGGGRESPKPQARAVHPEAKRRPRAADRADGPWSRTLTALKDAWAARREREDPSRSADEADFLPAALSLQARPPHPAPRWLAASIAALLLLLLMAAVIGRVDVIVAAPGRVVVTDGTKLVQPVETAVVRRVHVRDGDRVEAGQLLVELDATEAVADQSGIERQRADAQAEGDLSSALLSALTQGRAPQASPWAEGGGRAATARLWARWQEIQATRSQLGAEQARRQAEARTVREAMARVDALLPIAQQREADIETLAAQGFVAAHAGQDRRRERIELERERALQAARLEESNQALRLGEQASRAAEAALRRELTDRHAEALARRELLDQQQRKADRREQLTRLLAPAAGTVQQLAVHTEGGVVTPAQTLMVIVPRDAALTAEVLIRNQDIADVRIGQQAQVKVEAYPFARHGTVSARLTRVAADAVADERLGAVFPATVNIDRPPAGGLPMVLGPGMNVEVEIAVARRRLIAFFLPALEERVHRVLSIK